MLRISRQNEEGKDMFEEVYSKIEDYCNYRIGTGYSGFSAKKGIKKFLDYCLVNFPDETTITKNMVDSWLNHRAHMSSNTQAKSVTHIRNFSNYLNFIGIHSYIPDDDYNVKCIGYIPYVFSDYELKAFFDSVDNYTATKRTEKYHPDLVLPVIFRFMYCCGMRPGEPLRLLRNDVNLKTGDVYIRKTKCNKDRHIIISEDMRQLCSVYNSFSSPNRTYFIEYRGTACSIDWMGIMFHKCWDNSGLIKHGNPRPYDLRHAFASRNIIKWIDEGKDVMSLMPFLSEYMGHSSLQHTLYYIHMIPERLRNTSNIDWNSFSRIYGKSGEY